MTESLVFDEPTWSNRVNYQSPSNHETTMSEEIHLVELVGKVRDVMERSSSLKWYLKRWQSLDLCNNLQEIRRNCDHLIKNYGGLILYEGTLPEKHIGNR